MENGEGGVRDEIKEAPLQEEYSSSNNQHNRVQDDLPRRVRIESKKLWHIVGPSIFSRIASYSMNVVTQVFAGHLGDLELASISIANTVIIGFTFGLLLGMASALETLCGQAYGAKQHRMLGIYLQRSWVVLTLCAILLLPIYIFAAQILKFLGQPEDLANLTGRVTIWMVPLPFAFVFQFSLQRFLQSRLKTLIIAWVCFAALAVHIFVSWLFMNQKMGPWFFWGSWSY